MAGGGWTRRETVRLVLAGFILFGGFINIAFLLRKAARLSRPDAGGA